MTQSAPSPQELAAAIREALEPMGSVRQAYLFGSRAMGRASEQSDLDVAVKLARGLDQEERAQIKLAIIASLTDTLGALGERADIVDLDHASSTVAFRVIREGIRVLSRDDRERIRLEAYIARRYDDERPYRELYRRAAQATAKRMGGE